MNACSHCRARINLLRFFLQWRDYRCGRCGQRSRIPENQRLVLPLVNVVVTLIFLFAVGRQWQLWQRIALCLLVSLIVQTAVAGIFLRFTPAQEPGKPEDAR